jgi:hypothetical protein
MLEGFEKKNVPFIHRDSCARPMKRGQPFSNMAGSTFFLEYTETGGTVPPAVLMKAFIVTFVPLLSQTVCWTLLKNFKKKQTISPL